jgi:hypothetical protein
MCAEAPTGPASILAPIIRDIDDSVDEFEALGWL